jgi:hypothetical protein
MDELELAYLRSSFLEPKDGEIQMLQHLSCFILLHPASSGFQEWGFGEPSYMMARQLA